MSKTLEICAFLLCLCVHFVTPLYFHIGETERKCFIEEIPDETQVIGMQFQPAVSQLFFTLVLVLHLFYVIYTKF